ncbi:MAG: hypothetical protein GXP26_08170 [Planctomycetes bacterium]|nr:hypothetical protein [Planctomycetota bacterium]
MASTDSSNGTRRLTAFASWVHTNFLWLLVASYLLAAVFPGPGLAIRGLSVTQPSVGVVTAPMLLLALLLFCAAVVVRWSRVQNLLQRPAVLLLALVAIWVVPAGFVGLLGWALPLLLGEYVTPGMMVGLALVAAMPVANSSVAWCQNARGNMALGLGLIVMTIVLSPLAAPQMLKLMGLVLSEQETAQCERLVAQFSGTFFIIWVILPSIAGVVVNRLAGPDRIDRARGAIRLVSAMALLTLNYTNASLAMPKVFDGEGAETLLVSAVLAVSLSMLGLVSAWVLSCLLKLDRASGIALAFGFSMKHTGLALVLAGEVLHEEPRVILIIVLATLLQHIVAGGADWFLARRAESEESSSLDCRGLHQDNPTG